jgi:hypothetical protein
MKRSTIAAIIIMIICLPLSVLAFEDISSNIYINSKFGYSNHLLKFGLNSKATDHLDTALGETDVPPFTPPEGINCAFVIYEPKQQQDIWTYVDLRPYPKTDTEKVQYVLIIAKGGGDLITFRWDKPDSRILSAEMLDTLTWGKLVDINMKDSLQATVTNEFIDLLVIRVLYQNTVNTVEPAAGASSFPEIRQNGFSGLLSIESQGIYDFKIYSILGNTVNTGKILPGASSIDLESYQEGVYFIDFIGSDGRHFSKKILKTN